MPAPTPHNVLRPRLPDELRLEQVTLGQFRRRRRILRERVHREANEDLGRVAGQDADHAAHGLGIVCDQHFRRPPHCAHQRVVGVLPRHVVVRDRTRRVMVVFEPAGDAARLLQQFHEQLERAFAARLRQRRRYRLQVVLVHVAPVKARHLSILLPDLQQGAGDAQCGRTLFDLCQLLQEHFGPRQEAAETLTAP